jgi:hypothetical protein
MEITKNTTFILNNKEYNIEKLCVLKNFKKENLKFNPYPFLIIKNALDNDIYEYLENNYPSDINIFIEDKKHNYNTKIHNTTDKNIKKSLQNELKNFINKDKNMPSNTRFDLPSLNKDTYSFLDPIWKLFIDYHQSKLFVNKVKNVFGDHFIKFDNIQYKLNKKNIKNVDELTIGPRNKNLNNQTFDIVTDCQIGINTPCKNDSYVRGPHIDNLNENYAGLLYFKRDNEENNGGNLDIYDTKFKYHNLDDYQKNIKLLKNETLNIDNRSYRRKNEFDKNDVKIIDTVKYNKNTFVLFLNEINAIHGVSIRKKCNTSRRLVNIIGESYYENNDAKTRIKIWNNK